MIKNNVGFIKKDIALLSFSGSLSRMVTISDFTTCMCLNNQPCMARPTLIDLNPDEYNRRLGYYVFTVNLDRFNGSCNTLDHPSKFKCF